MFLSLITAITAFPNVSHAELIYFSYPNSTDPIFELNETNSKGVLFSSGQTDFRLTGLTAPLTYFSGYNLPGASQQIPLVPSLPVDFQI